MIPSAALSASNYARDTISKLEVSIQAGSKNTVGVLGVHVNRHGSYRGVLGACRGYEMNGGS